MSEEQNNGFQITDEELELMANYGAALEILGNQEPLEDIPALERFPPSEDALARIVEAQVPMIRALYDRFGPIEGNIDTQARGIFMRALSYIQEQQSEAYERFNLLVGLQEYGNFSERSRLDEAQRDSGTEDSA